MNSKTFVLCFLLTGIFAAVPPLSAETILDVEESVRLALENNLSLSRAKIETDGKKRTADHAWNSLIPSLSATATARHATSVLDDPVPDTWITGGSFTASLNLSPAIFSGISQTKRNYEAGLISYESARQDLELQVRKAFYQILLLENSVQLTEQSIATAQARYDQAAASARAGQSARLDELSAKVDLENLKPNLKSVQAQYDNALDSFKYILGLPQEEEIALDGVLDVSIDSLQIADWPAGSEPYSIASLRKSMEVLEAQKSSAWHQAYMPTLSLSWSTAPMYTHSTGSWADSSGAFSVGLSFKLDSYLPWSSARDQVASLNDSLEISRIAINEAVLGSDLNVRQYQRTIEQSIESIEVLQLNVELAEQTYAMYEESYRNGGADLQSLRSAGDSLLMAQNQVQQEYYNLLAATLDLEKELNVPFGTLWSR